MKKVITAYLDNLENEINAQTKVFPNAKVETLVNMGNNAVAVIIETGEETKVEIPATSSVAVNFSIISVEKLPAFSKAKAKIFYVLSVASGENAPGTVWVKGTETLEAVTTIDVLEKNNTN